MHLSQVVYVKIRDSKLSLGFPAGLAVKNPPAMQ